MGRPPFDAEPAVKLSFNLVRDITPVAG